MGRWTKVKLARVDVEAEKGTNLNGLVPKHGGDILPTRERGLHLGK